MGKAAARPRGRGCGPRRAVRDSRRPRRRSMAGGRRSPTLRCLDEALARIRGVKRLNDEHRNRFITGIRPLVGAYVRRSLRLCRLSLQPHDLDDLTSFVNLYLLGTWFGRVDLRRPARVIAGYLRTTVHGLARRWMGRRARQNRCPPERRRYSAIDRRFAEVDRRIDEEWMGKRVEALTRIYQRLRPGLSDRRRHTVARMMRLLVREENDYA